MTIGTSTTDSATRVPFQRKSFHAVGRFWVFYATDGNMVYRTSTTGSNWSSATTVRACVDGYNFSIWFDETYLHYAYAGNGSLYYRRGTPISDGTITWADEQTVPTVYNTASVPFVSVDSNGYAWIGYGDYQQNIGTHSYVIKSGNNDGTWGTTPAPFPYHIGSEPYDVTVIPLTVGKMYIIICLGGIPVYGRLWTGSMSAEELISTSHIYNSAYCSAVADSNDDVYLVFLKDYPDLDILHVKRTYGVGWGSETTIKAGTTYYSAPVLSIADTILYCFWGTITTDAPLGAVANHIYYQKSTDGGATWDTMVDWINESTEILTNPDRITCFYKVHDDNFGLVYMTKTTTPYNIKLGYSGYYPDMSMVGGPTSWSWEEVQCGVSVVPVGGPTGWSWETMSGTKTIPFGNPTSWKWKEVVCP